MRSPATDANSRIAFSVALLAATALLCAAPRASADSLLWGNTGRVYQLDVSTGAIEDELVIDGVTSIGATDLAGDAGTQGPLLWGVTFNGNLIAVNPLAQQLLSTKPLVSPETIATLAIDPTTGNFFGASANNLYRIAPDTGVATLIGVTNLQVNKGLGFDSLGNLYGIGNENRLSAVNKSTGAASLITALNLYRMEDIAVHPETGVMYGIGYGYNTDNYSLYQINLADGALTRLGPSIGRPSGLAFTGVPEPSSAIVALLGAAIVLLKHPRRSRSPNQR